MKWINNINTKHLGTYYFDYIIIEIFEHKNNIIVQTIYKICQDRIKNNTVVTFK